MKRFIYSVMLLVFLSPEGSLAKNNEKLMDACNNGDKESCYTLGLKYFDSSDMNKIVKGAILLNQACNMNYTSACVVLGWMNYDGKIIEKGYAQADNYFNKACKLKDVGGCQGLAEMYDNGHGIHKDNNQSLSLIYHELACEYGSPHNCYMAGLKNEQTDTVEKNVCNAVYYYYKSCTSEIAQGCEEFERLKVHKECFEE